MNKVVKKVALVAAAAAMVCVSISPAFAAGPSITANGTPVGEVLIDGKVVEGSTASFQDDFSYLQTEKEEDKNAASAIEKLNEGASLKETLVLEEVKLPKGVKLNLEDYSLLTRVQDLSATDKDGNALEEDVTLTWEVVNLTKEAGDVYVLHYSTKRSTWEIIKPEEVNYESKTVTAHFDDLSPVAVIYKSSESAVVEKPNTGSSTNTLLYAGLGAVALIGIGVFAFKKKN